ncbi:CaiB/BaiF CoA-transferase family protein [Bosea sp. BIWAKO-01]|uniref:CaiB/BaiF CoA transferase family protein n=1 Tax=Bosea sp. BIWAKO-01 TaxID=506668 RepID=UPI000853BA12|nr:CaiB/BaiF CoA-transferase family protein [Bosea sp. BIWAKO-01]GAU83062.1 L-carnitine dehydratase/bile acid-inducible protein F [Bosea sp. BIWAKO-01]
MIASDLPLTGIRVLDLSRILAGPWCGQVLADLGADVIKVEHPQRGDDTRDWGMRLGERNTCYFNSVNRNKRSIGIDLGQPDGLAIVLELARKSDVLIQNFKTGGADKLGLGYAALNAENPGLIYCSIAGYGSAGPEAARPGYDLVIQGESGLMAMNGNDDQPPLKFGVAIADLFTGQYAAQAVLAALVQRGRTGKGRHVEMALFDCGLSVTSYYGLEALALGEDPPRYGNAHPSIVPYGVFDAADGALVLTVGNNAQYDRFCRAVIDRVDLAENPRYATNLQRTIHRSELLPLIEAELRARPRAELLAKLAANGIPCGEVLGLNRALRSERAGQAGMLVEDGDNAGAPAVLAPPYRLDGERLPVRHMPPALGRDTWTVLKDELGLPAERLDALKARDVIA